MNITYLIGNGFDLAAGLDTTFENFYNYLVNQRQYFFFKYPFANKLKKSEFWKDLELGLGKITTQFKCTESSIQVYENFYVDLTEELIEYIEMENNKIKEIPEDVSKYINISYDKILRALTYKESLIISNKFSSNQVYTYNFITFNYTDILTKCLMKIKLSHKSQDRFINDYIKPPIHIHSNLKNKTRALLGVNDKSQIENESLRDFIEDVCVKPAMNNILGSDIVDKVTNIIDASNIICIFGHSLGDTDKIW